jgi:hypothetical protein
LNSGSDAIWRNTYCPIFPVLLTHLLVTGLSIFPGGHPRRGDVLVERLRDVLVERLREDLVERLREDLVERLREDLEERLREDLEERLREDLVERLREDLRFSSSFPVRVSGLIHLRLVPEQIFPSGLQSLSFLQDLLIYNYK